MFDRLMSSKELVEQERRASRYGKSTGMEKSALFVGCRRQYTHLEGETRAQL